MAADAVDALSHEHREPVRAALDAAFGSSRVDSIAFIGGGASGAFPFRVELGRQRYLVRLEGRASPLRNPHQYESMRIASAAGIAPKLHHVDEANRVAIMDFVDERPLRTFPDGPTALASALGTILSRVQGTPTFPAFVEYPEIVARLWRWVCRTGLFAPGVLAPHTQHLARLRESYVWDTTASVSSHNDPVPRNVLFDGQRLWLIDWESAYRNDPLVDVAIALDSFAPTPDLEQVLLQAWLGQTTDVSISDRLAKVRALTRLYYAGVFLSASAAASGALADHDISAPTVPAFRRAILNGEITHGSPKAKHILGKMYLSSYRRNATRARRRSLNWLPDARLQISYWADLVSCPGRSNPTEIVRRQCVLSGTNRAQKFAADCRDPTWLMPTSCLRRRRDLAPPDGCRTASRLGRFAPAEPHAQRLPPPRCAHTRPPAGRLPRAPTRSIAARARPSSSRLRCAPGAAATPAPRTPSMPCAGSNRVLVRLLGRTGRFRLALRTDRRHPRQSPPASRYFPTGHFVGLPGLAGVRFGVASAHLAPSTVAARLPAPAPKRRARAPGFSPRGPLCPSPQSSLTRRVVMSRVGSPWPTRRRTRS